MRFNEATIEALQGESIRERAGMPVLPAVYSRHLAVLALAPLGEFDEATARAEEGFRIAEAVDHPLSQLYMYMAGGFLHAYRGELSEAIRLLEHGRMLCEVTGRPADLRMDRRVSRLGVCTFRASLRRYPATSSRGSTPSQRCT